jgi:hypothetical protein
MQHSQLELWSAEPHPTPQLDQQLMPQQWSQLVSHLAELMLKMVQSPPTPPTSNPSKDHER